MHEFRQVFLLGLIVGIIVEIFGVVALSSYFGGNQTSVYLIGGVCSVIVGILFLAKSIPAFIPKKKTVSAKSCPYCGSIQNANAAVFEKCKQQID